MIFCPLAAHRKSIGLLRQAVQCNDRMHSINMSPYTLFIIPIAIQASLATVMIMGHVMNTQGFMVVQTFPRSRDACFPPVPFMCSVNMTYSPGGNKDISMIKCMFCDDIPVQKNNTHVTIYYSLVDRSSWKFDGFGSFTLAVILYATLWGWVLVAIAICVFASQMRSAHGVRPETPAPANEAPTDVQMVQVRPASPFHEPGPFNVAELKDSESIGKLMVGHPNIDHDAKACPVIIVQP